MTVAELRKLLEGLPDDTIVVTQGTQSLVFEDVAATCLTAKTLVGHGAGFGALPPENRFLVIADWVPE